MKFRNKILISFLFLLTFILFFYIDNVFAFSYFHNCKADNCDFSCYFYYPDNIPSLTLSLGDKSIHIHYFFIVDDNGIYRLIGYNNMGVPENGYLYMNGNTIKYNNFRAIDMFYYDSTTCDWVYDGYSWDQYVLSEGVTIVASSSDIYTDIDKTELFFQVPPQKVEVITIPTLETVEELPKVILEILKMMIPVCLVLLGMVLVIYLIRRLRYWI